MLQRPVEPAVYTSKAYAALCEQLGVTQSTGAVGTSADNSLAESFNATLKRELLAGRSAFPDQSARRFPDLIGRDFSVGDPGRRYVGDITYLPIADGTNLYLASCIDLGSRKLAGWQVADHMRTELVEDALRAAHHDRGSLVGAIFHSDHGSVGGFNRSSQHPLGITGGMGDGKQGLGEEDQ